MLSALNYGHLSFVIEIISMYNILLHIKRITSLWNKQKKKLQVFRIVLISPSNKMGRNVQNAKLVTILCKEFVLIWSSKFSFYDHCSKKLKYISTIIYSKTMKVGTELD